MTETIHEVLESEKKAERIVEEAKIHKIKDIEKAKQDSLADLAKKQAKIDSKIEEDIEKKRQELEAVKENIKKQGEKEVKAMETKARKNIDKATEFVLAEFEKRLK